MELRLYDTLTRDKRVFTPLDPSRVRSDVCGPTVYDFAMSAMRARSFVFDVLTVCCVIFMETSASFTSATS